MRRDRLTTFGLIGTIAVLALGLDQLRARAHHEWTEAQTYEDVYYLPPREWLGVFSLGWDEALADLIWMRALIYYGDEVVNHGDVEFVFRYGEAIEALDPSFVAVYRWVGTAGLYRPQAITVEDVEQTIAFMERGARRHPNDGDLAWELGAVLAYELPPMLEDPEAANRSRERAVPFLVRASRLGAAPEWAVLSNASLMGRVGRTDQAARHLEEMYERTSDPATRERMATQIRQLREQAHAEAFLTAMDQLEERRRATFPYVPSSLFLLLGDRPPVDLDAPIAEGLPAAFASEE